MDLDVANEALEASRRELQDAEVIKGGACYKRRWGVWAGCAML